MTPGLAATAAPTVAKWTIALIMVLMVREMVWKGISLWKAGSKKQLVWFIFLFVFNTA